MDQVRFLFTAAAAFCAAALALFAEAAPRGEVFDRRALADLETVFRSRGRMRDVRMSFFWSRDPAGPGLRVRYCPEDAVFDDAPARRRQMEETALDVVLHHPETFAVVELVAAARPDLLLPADRPRHHAQRVPTAEIVERLRPEKRREYGRRAWPLANGVAMREWKWIVIHHTALGTGNAASVERWHRRGRGWENGMGYHFLVGNGTGSYDGEIEVLERWPQQLQGAHVGGSYPGEDGEKKFWNDIAIGISLVGNFEESAPTAAQMDALRRLVRYLVEEYDIPVGRVVGHREFPGQHTKCPGARFSTEDFRERLRELEP